MRSLRLSIAGTATFLLLGALGAAGLSAQGTGQPFDSLLLGSCQFPLDAACEAGVRSICDAQGQTTFGRAAMHAEHCPQTSGPSNTDAELGILFDDGSSLTATYAITCEPLMPEGAALMTCTPYSSGEVTGGTGRFDGATGSISFDPAYVYFDGVTWPAVDLDWVGILRGSVEVVPAVE